MPRTTSLRTRLLAVASTAALVVSGLLVTSAPASADTAPPVTTPVTAKTVSADVLPTVQIDGVVWAQVVVGNTVYAAGSFKNARPAGAAAGTNLTARNNLLAYDITTGNLVTSFVPNLNGQALAIAASPDGKRLYVGGDFTTANGSSRSRIAAYDLTNNTLVANFKPTASTTVRAITATNSTVYFGGDFTTVNGVSRPRAAAVDVATGNLLDWNPNADAPVTAMTLTTDGSRVVLGGRFQNIGGAAWYGMAAVSPTTGAPLAWAATDSVRNAGVNADITSLTANGDSVYGTGYVYGAGGNLEGTFRADQTTGALTWVEDCHGDSYSSYAGNSDLVYVASHSHFCGDLGGFQQTPTPWVMYRATAFTKAATQTLSHNPYGGYKDWYGTPAPTLLNWFPTFTPGTFTGAGQASWSVTGNSQYTVYGGEFPSVNGVAQQGLVRFAVSTLAPNKIGPNSNDDLTPSVVGLPSGGVRVSWLQTFDRDNTSLTYKVYRNFKSTSDTPIYTATATNTFWQRNGMGFVDNTAVAGQTYNYRVYVSDPFGNTVSRGATSITASGPDSGADQTYPNAVLADQPQTYWRLGESSTTSAYDSVAYNDGVKAAGVTRSTDGIVAGDSKTASTFDGNSDGFITSPAAAAAPDTFSVEAWVKTSSTTGGKIIGYGSANTGTSSSYDRHVYMDNAGHLVFGVYTGATATLTTTGVYNDNAWHQVVATLGASGMQLFVDGKRVGARSDVTKGQPYTGYWRVGGDSLNGWPAAPSSQFLAGEIDEVAIYPTVLNVTQVNNHYVASGRTSTVPTRPADAYGRAVFDLSPSLYWRLNDASGATVAADSGQLGNPGNVGSAVTFGAAGALFGQPTTAATFAGTTGGTVVAAAAEPGPTTYSEAVWFNTTTTSGGKLIGFGNGASGSSSSYDRHVYMQNDGTLVFGTWTGTANVITTPAAYNDGKWHMVVATQGSAGMVLYVDGKAVGTNPQTNAQAYNGYWRIGGDPTWGSASPFFAGTLDEAAVFSTALSSSQVGTLYAAGTGPANQSPTAAFSSSAADLVGSFDGSASDDTDGSVASYSWNFGDNTAAGSGVKPSHSYAAAGTYSVVLTVTDDKGATGSVTHPITVTEANKAPAAAFSSSATNLVGSFDGSGSDDADGSVASYAWDFGDNSAAGSGVTPAHTYQAAGTYSVVLTVTDDQGATASMTHAITVTAANKAPTAAFSSSAANLVATFDGSASDDTDGSVASYSWNFGDNSAAGSGVKPAHTYAAAGTYSVVLTVTDDKGATASVTHTVSVVAAGVAPLATDKFGRTVSGGLGTADLGGAWTVAGTAANYAVNGSAAKFTMGAPSATLTASLASVSSTNTDVKVDFSLDKAMTGSGVYVTLVGRRISSATDYRTYVKINSAGAVTLVVSKRVGGTETVLNSKVVSGLTFTPGTPLTLRLQVKGTTSVALNAKVWTAGGTEPAGWQTSLTDSTADLAGAGGIGLVTYLSGSATNAPVVATFDNLSAQPVN